MLRNEAKGPCFGIRYVQALLLFFHIFIIIIMRLNVSVALVAMTDPKKDQSDSLVFHWSEQQKSYILSSFYWGYIAAQFPGTYLLRFFGVKWLLSLSTFSAATSSLILPFCVTAGGWQVFCVLRACQGICQGIMLPTWIEHIAKWSPPAERNCIGTFSLTGGDCGSIAANLVSGLIASSSLDWPYIFYLSAAFAFAWLIPWLIFAANDASKSKFISEAEREYIQSSLGQSLETGDGELKKIPIPWKAILTSVPFIVLTLTRTAFSWGFSIIQMQLPLYFNGVMGVDIKSNALYSSLPFLALWICSYIFLFVAQIIVKKNLLKLITLRKTFNSLALWVPAAAFLGIGFIDSLHSVYAIVLITFVGGICASHYIGSYLNIIDLSPNHAGIVSVFISVISNLTSLITPIFIGVIVTDETDRKQWLIVFITTAVINILGNIIFLIWAKTERQPWDDADFLTRPADND